MEWWWILVVAPLYGIWQALSEAWTLLLEAGSDDEREQIMVQAGLKAFANTAGAVGIWLVPWPYKLLCWAPILFPALVKTVGTVLHIMISFSPRNLNNRNR